MSIAAVYDTMVFLQQAARPERVHGTFQAIHDGRVTLCLSGELVAEVEDVLGREEMRAKFPSLTPEAVTVFVEDLLVRGRMFLVQPVYSLPGHPDDDHVINLAIAADADYLVTWEARLLRLDLPESEEGRRLKALAPRLAIVTPAEFVKRIRVGEGE